jgi:hypothetical protein
LVDHLRFSTDKDPASTAIYGHLVAKKQTGNNNRNGDGPFGHESAGSAAERGTYTLLESNKVHIPFFRSADGF